MRCHWCDYLDRRHVSAVWLQWLPTVALLLAVATGSTRAQESNPECYELFIKPSVAHIEYDWVAADQSTGKTVGSGFVIASSGFILTDAHVLRADVSEGTPQPPIVTATIKVRLGGLGGPDSDFFTAEIARADQQLDIAVIKVLPKAGALLTPLYLDLERPIKVGTDLFGYGYGEGNDLTFIGRGVVTAINAVVANVVKPNWIQTSLLLVHGDSGGPIFRTDGSVVALAGALLDQHHPGITYVTPLALAKDFIQAYAGPPKENPCVKQTPAPSMTTSAISSATAVQSVLYVGEYESDARVAFVNESALQIGYGHDRKLYQCEDGMPLAATETDARGITALACYTGLMVIDPKKAEPKFYKLGDMKSGLMGSIIDASAFTIVSYHPVDECLHMWVAYDEYRDAGPFACDTRITSIHFGDDYTFAVGTSLGLVRVYQNDSNGPPKVLHEETLKFNAAHAFDPDFVWQLRFVRLDQGPWIFRLVAVGFSNVIYVLQLNSDDLTWTTTPITHSVPKTSITCADLSSDGRYVAFGTSDGFVTIWDLDKKKLAQQYFHDDYVSLVSFGQTSDIVVSAGVDLKLKTFRVSTGAEIGEANLRLRPAGFALSPGRARVAISEGFRGFDSAFYVQEFSLSIGGKVALLPTE